MNAFGKFSEEVEQEDIKEKIIKTKYCVVKNKFKTMVFVPRDDSFSPHPTYFFDPAN